LGLDLWRGSGLGRWRSVDHALLVCRWALGLEAVEAVLEVGEELEGFVEGLRGCWILFRRGGLGEDVGAAALVGADEAFLAEDLHGPLHGPGRDAVVFGEPAGRWELVTLVVAAGLDVAAQRVGDLEVGQARVVGPDRHARDPSHTANYT
jgi:hypothetical protein